MIARATLRERPSWWILGAILTVVLLPCLSVRATRASDFGEDSQSAAIGSNDGVIYQDQ